MVSHTKTNNLFKSANLHQKGADGFLVLDRQISLVRYEVMGQAPGALDPLGPEKLRMIVLLANPEDPQFASLKLDIEQENIKDALIKAVRDGFFFFF